MASIRRVFNTFLSGEWSPLAEGRTDLEKYYKAARQIVNFLLQNVGGVTTRPGFRRVADTKKQDGTNLRAHVMYSTAGDAYFMEIGDQYIRFYYDGAFFTEISTQYLAADIFDLHFAQIGDVLYIAHSSYYPAQLRNNNGAFSLTQINFDPPPTEPISIFPAGTITPGATSGAGVTFTLGTASSVILGNQDQTINNLSGPGKAVIQSITDTTHIVADIIENFPSTAAIPNLSWSLTGPFNATLSGLKDKPVGKIVTLTSDQPIFASSGVNDMTGDFIKVNSGEYKITSVTDTTHVKAKIVGELTSTTNAGPGTWTIEKTSWTVAGTFPSTVAFAEDRLTYANGLVVWLSKTDDYVDFSAGANDADSVQETIASGDHVSDIQWLLPADDILLGTELQELKLTSGDGKALSPTNAGVKHVTSKGGAAIQPIKLDSSVVFIEAGAAKVGEIQFDLQSNTYVSRDLTFVAEHIGQGNITQMFRQRRPTSMIWIVNGAKQLCGLRLDYVESILGWQRVVIDGQILSAIAVPQFTTGPVKKAPWEDIYAITKRTIGGVDKYSIERMDFTPIDHPKQAVDTGQLCLTDFGVVRSGGAPVSSLSGLAHLAGQTVQVIGDGVEQGARVVDGGGTVVVDPPASVIDAGLFYGSTLESMPPDIPGGPTIAGSRKRWTEAWARIYKTAGIKINGEEIDPARAPRDVETDATTGLMTGDVQVKNLGYSRKGTIKIERTRPLRATILSIFGTLDVERS